MDCGCRTGFPEPFRRNGADSDVCQLCKKKEDIALSGFSAAASNEVCEVGIAGMMTVPAAVAFLGVAGAAGQGTFALGFMVLPQAFAKMGSSVVFGSLFSCF